MAPEIFTEQRYSIQSDLYALGITLWELVARKVACSPATMMSKIQWHIQHMIEDVQELVPDCPPALAKAIMQLCESEAGKRPATVSDALLLWPSTSQQTLSNVVTTQVNRTLSLQATEHNKHHGNF